MNIISLCSSNSGSEEGGEESKDGVEAGDAAAEESAEEAKEEEKEGDDQDKNGNVSSASTLGLLYPLFFRAASVVRTTLRLRRRLRPPRRLEMSPTSRRRRTR